MVLCVDEKSQIQALDRTAPILPMMPGTPARASHDYIRAGTSSLYAALDIATGKVIGSLHARHRAIEFQKFLARSIDRGAGRAGRARRARQRLDPQDPGDQALAGRPPSLLLHFTPTSSSWLNLVERWFGELTTKKLQRGTHRSVRELNADIRAWIDDLERQPPALRLDQDRRPDPRHHRPLLHPN